MTTYTSISAVHNVARYLPEFFASLEAQTYGLHNVDVILVDDGSTDDSLELCQEFAARHATVQIFAQTNAGQGAARNAGLEHANGEWVTFPDPDDMLDDEYFASVERLRVAHADDPVAMFVGHMIMWREATGVFADNHPMAFRFHNGSRVINLEEYPDYVGAGPLTFFRRTVVENHGIRFDDRLRTRFEDAKFVLEYLLAADSTLLGLVSDARYLYRRRADGSSTLQTAMMDPRTYAAVARYGYLPLLKDAREHFGTAPRWLQTFIAYSILWMMKGDARDQMATLGVEPTLLAQFVDELAQVSRHLDPELVMGFNLMHFDVYLRFVLAYGFADVDHIGAVYIDDIDESKAFVRMRYRYTGDRPTERLVADTVTIRPRHQTTIVRKVFGAPVIRERILWIARTDRIRFELNGRPQPFHVNDRRRDPMMLNVDELPLQESAISAISTPTKFTVRRVGVRKSLRSTAGRWFRQARRAVRKSTLSDTAVALELRMPWYRRRFLDAWVLMDGERVADDNAEELYRWLRAEHPEINAWFVIRQDSPDWQRLHDDGFKLCPYGSRSWRVLVLMASELISSRADAPIVNPFSRRYGIEPWRFTFLQQGVLTGNMSGWLNPKPIRTLATSTQSEYDYISGPSPYKHSTRETRLTGLPRFDSLLRKEGRRIDDPDIILIAPTLRASLSRYLGIHSELPERDGTFMTSVFAQRWRAVLASDALKMVADDFGKKVVFMPHPDIEPYLQHFSLPKHVEVAIYGRDDPQQMTVRASAVITDYSSIAFEMAYLRRPVVYFQFAAREYGAQHVERPGYFDYERDGFGPVRDNSDDVIASLRSVLSGWGTHFANRAVAAFPVRDGGNSRRVFEAIVAAKRTLSREEATVAATPDSWN